MYGWRYHEVDRSPAQYEKRLETLVGRLEKTGARLIWATTTPPCPAPEQTMLKRFNKTVYIPAELEREYAAAALRVMCKHGVAVNDLHALMAPNLGR
jgi:acyl-CoA thioesterase-1